MNARLLALLAGIPFALGVTLGVTAAPIAPAAAGEPASAVEAPDMPMSDMPMSDMPMEAMTAMHAADPAAMDDMHAAMADQMPPKLRKACDEMHAAMSDGEALMPMAGEAPAGMPGNHAAHHR